MLDTRVDDGLDVFATDAYQHTATTVARDQGRDMAVVTTTQQIAFPIPGTARASTSPDAY